MPHRKEIWPTTLDNPFDPFTQFDRWNRFDEDAGYYTCSRVADLAALASGLTDAEIDSCINDAIFMLISFYWPNEVYTLAVEGQTQKWGLHTYD